VSDLHHWDDAEAFSAQEAAALVVGIDPLDPQAPLWKAGPVLERMKKGHGIAKNFVTQPKPMTPTEFELQRKSRAWADALVSVLFDLFPVLQKNPWPSDPDRPYELLARFAGPDGEFQVQKFARTEIQRWLSVVGIRSAYQFDRKQLNAGPFRVTPAPPVGAVGASGSDKPWKEQARARADEIIKRDKAKDLYPSQVNIADEIAKQFRKDGLTGADGKPLTGAYIKRWALKGISSAQSKLVSTVIRQSK
jgi:hypothetical protein